MESVLIYRSAYKDVQTWAYNIIILTKQLYG